LIMIGVYILPKKIFNIIRQTPIDEAKWEILLPDSLKILMKQWEKIYPYITNYPVRDTGTPESWLKANIEIFKWETQITDNL
jgi:UTP-glucose-1-phosphate uridylyltransferase